MKEAAPAAARVFHPFLPLLLLAAAAPGAARAVPPDEVRALEPGASRIERPPFGEIAQATAVEVDAAATVSAELLPAGEVLIEAKAPGVARVFVFGRRAVRVLQIAVGRRAPPPAGGEPGSPPALTDPGEPARSTGPPRAVSSPPRAAPAPPRAVPAGKGACALPAEPGSDLVFAVSGEACFRALAASADALPPGRVPTGRYRFELEGLQAQARAAQALLGQAGLSHLRVSFSPYGVKFAGAKGAAERRRAAVAVYPAVLGPLRLDD